MSTFSQTEPIIVLDFETTGLYPGKGDRVIEIGAVLLREQKLLSGFRVL